MARAGVDGPHDESGEELVRALEQECPRLRRIASRFGLRGEEVNDAVQDVVALAWAARGSFRGDSKASTWLTRIAVNHFTSRRRKLARRFQRWMERPAEPERVETQASVDTRERYERALAALDRLPAGLKQVFVLRYLEELPADDVAEILGIPAGTVRSRGYHARLRLRKLLQDDTQ